MYLWDLSVKGIGGHSFWPVVGKMRAALPSWEVGRGRAALQGAPGSAGAAGQPPEMFTRGKHRTLSHWITNVVNQ